MASRMSRSVATLRPVQNLRLGEIGRDQRCSPADESHERIGRPLVPISLAPPSPPLPGRRPQDAGPNLSIAPNTASTVGASTSMRS